MKNSLRSVVLTLCAVPPAFSQVPCLFHTPQEQEAVLRARGQLTTGQSAPEAALSFHLSGLVYAGPHAWKIWINGKRYQPEAFPGLHVTHVAPHQVSFRLSHKKRSYDFVLRPNGRYVLGVHE